MSTFYLFKMYLLLCTRRWCSVSQLQLKGHEGSFLRWAAGRGTRSIRSLATPRSHQRPQVLPVCSRLWRAHCISGDPRAVERLRAAQRGRKLGLPTPLHPSATIIFVIKRPSGSNPRGRGSSSSSSSSSSSLQPREPHRARRSAGRARFRGKSNVINSLVPIISASPPQSKSHRNPHDSVPHELQKPTDVFAQTLNAHEWVELPEWWKSSSLAPYLAAQRDATLVGFKRRRREPLFRKNKWKKMFTKIIPRKTPCKRTRRRRCCRARAAGMLMLLMRRWLYGWGAVDGTAADPLLPPT